MNLASLIDPHPDEAVALISRGHQTTYGDLRDQVARLRGGLAGAGLEPGDRVAIVCSNNWYFVATYLAVLGAGMVAVPLNPLSPAKELQRELQEVGARAAMVGPSATGAWGGIDRTALPELGVVVTAGDGVAGAVAMDDLLGADPAPMVDRRPDDLAVLVFTSGTAGSPRAAMLTHGNLRSNIDQMLASPAATMSPEGDIGFGVLPLFHIFGLNVILGLSMAAGAAVLLVERFDPVSAAETIGRHRVNVVAGAPAMWTAWANTPDLPADTFAHVRLATSGASRLSPEVAARIEERFGLVVHEGYGLTEAGPAVSSTAGFEAKRGSVGKPFPGVRVRLVDASGDDVLIGDEGEIWVQGPNVFAGYWGDPETTSHVLTSDGWLRTGDLAVVDDDGYLYLVDRAKDLIIVSGFNVFPAEVEEVLMLHPAIEQAAVVGVSHPYSGEAVKAFVVVAPGHSIEEDDVIRFVGNHLARYKCPEKVMFVDELPQNITGKVLRRALR